MSTKPILKPLFDRAFIEFVVDPDAPIESVGEIVMPKGFKPAPKEGEGFPYYAARIVAVGPEVKHIAVGDEIVIPRDRVEKFSLGLHTYWQVTEKSIVGIVAPETKADA